EIYGGRGVGNYGAVIATSTPWHGRPASAEVTLPVSGVLWLRLDDADVRPGAGADAAERPARG
ncbi:MAG TPA: hypothetical protein VK935_14300, partial [Actinomycetospora sp.]|nr:hypothetical protein [Actinomycetospora sp.]